MAAFDARFPVSPSVIATYRDVFGLDLAALPATSEEFVWRGDPPEA